MVACFDDHLAASEAEAKAKRRQGKSDNPSSQGGSLGDYMLSLAKTPLSSPSGDYRLDKDGSQWGTMDSETSSKFFVLWPPWVKNR